MTVKDWLHQASASLAQAGIPSASLDAELILSHQLTRPRSWLIAHDDQPLSASTLRAINSLLARRRQRQPLAYLLGEREFYGRTFTVTPATLIPRPETESLVRCALELLPAQATTLDVGTGSGCIAVSLACERPDLRLQAIDSSSAALAVATVNAARHQVNVSFSQADITEFRPPTALQAIVANLPYVDPAWPRSAETAYEPAQALFAGRAGLELIFRLIDRQQQLLAPGGYLILEADPRQQAAILARGQRQALAGQAYNDYVSVLLRAASPVPSAPDRRV